MTPAEMLVLFSGNVVAFLLIWLTGLWPDQATTRESCASQIRKKTFHHTSDVLRAEQKDILMYWNVRSFLGIKH
jgi:hypothetical protein